MASHSFTGSPSSDNPGTRISNSVTLLFESHLDVTEFSFDVNSLNTRGIAWEFTTIEFLDPSGAPMNAAPAIDPYLSHTEIDGSPSQGVYVLDEKGTVLNVGTSDVSSGSSNSNENFTSTGDLDYSDVGIDVGTSIGGIRMTTFLEDVRGTTDGNTNFTSRLIDFTFSGTIDPPPVPEPGTTSLMLLGVATVALRRRR